MKKLCSRWRTKEVLLCVLVHHTQVDTANGSKSAPYASFLKGKVAQRDVIEYGNPGETTERMKSRIHDVFGQFKGDRVERFILLGGVNDFGQGCRSESVVKNLRALAESAHSYGAEKVIVMTIPVFPNAMVVEDLRKRIEAVNCMVLSSMSDVAVVVDLASHLKGDDVSMWDKDGLHPNAKGYEKIADVLLELKKELFVYFCVFTSTTWPMRKGALCSYAIMYDNSEGYGSTKHGFNGTMVTVLWSSDTCSTLTVNFAQCANNERHLPTLSFADG